MQYTCACVIVYHVCHGYYGGSNDVNGDLNADLRITGYLLHMNIGKIYINLKLTLSSI